MSFMPSGEPLICDCSSDEIERLHEIDRVCFPDYMAYSRTELHFFLRHPFSIGKMAVAAATICGFAIGRCRPGSLAHVITLDVIPEARRHGVGAMLMAALHEEFRKRDCTQVALEVAAGNSAAQRFYEALGYRRVKLLPGYYQGRQDAYHLEKLL